MELSVVRIQRSPLIVSMLALAICAGTMQASNTLKVTPISTATLNCSSTAGTTPLTVVVAPVTAITTSATILVGFQAPTGGVVVTAPNVTTPATTLDKTTNKTLNYTVSLAPGCVGVTPSAPVTVTFTAAGQADVQLTVNVGTVTTSTSGLSAAPSSVAVTCVYNGPNSYTPGPAQNITVTSAAGGGTPFTSATGPGWLTFQNSPTANTIATAAGVTFSVVANCTNQVVGPPITGQNIHLVEPLIASDKLIPVTLQVLNPTPLTETPVLTGVAGSVASMSYTKGSGIPGFVDVRIASALQPAPFFTVDTTSLPSWLNVDTVMGTAPKLMRFTSTTIAESLSPGTYSQNVRLNVVGYGALTIPVTLLLNNPAPKLTVTGGLTQTTNYTIGGNVPVSATINLVSSDSPISFTLSGGGSLIQSVSPTSGLAYNFGTPVTVNFNQAAFSSATPGSQLTGTVTITWGSPATSTVVNFNVAVQSSQATLTSIVPSSLPTAAPPQTFSVTLYGTGFVAAGDVSQNPTRVGIVVGGALVVDNNLSWRVVNPSAIQLTIAVPALTPVDPYLPFTGTGGSVVIGICNPSGANTSCTTPQGIATISIGSKPIIQAVTSASKFIQVVGPPQTIAPYDLISIFGNSFCTPCTGANAVIYSNPDATYQTYPMVLSPDLPTASNPRNISVSFFPHGSLSTTIPNAPLLFASNNQINAVVPGELVAGSSYDIVVNFGYGAGANMSSSLPYQVNVIATNPGIFTVGSDGQGDGAILNSSWSAINMSNPAALRSTLADSDSVVIYMTGLGAPIAGADNADPGNGPNPVYITDCVSTGSYLHSLNAVPGQSINGAILQFGLLNSYRMVPCVLAPTVTIGGVSANVTYAGWVPNSITGLYQLNVSLPASNGGPFFDATGTQIGLTNSLTAPAALPVVVTANGISSQTGVNIWVAPRLKVTGPTGAGLTGQVGVAWSASNNAVQATEGQAPYRYSLSAGILPSGLNLDPLLGTISGIPAGNTTGRYTVTVTAMDSANIPISGAVTFTLTVGSGLALNLSTAPVTAIAGAINANISTVSASGGIGPYTYTVTGTPLPTGVSLAPLTGILSTSNLTVFGNTTITITATDATPGTHMTGTITFPISITRPALVMSVTNSPVTTTAGIVNANLARVNAAGGTAPITFAAVGSLPQGVFIASDGTISVDATTVAGTPSVTVKATDSTAGTAMTGTTTFSITILTPLVITAPGALAVDAGSINASLFALQVSNGTGPFTFSQVGTVTGVHIASNGAISVDGSQVAGSPSITVRATDGATGAVGTLTFTLTVNPALTLNVPSPAIGAAQGQAGIILESVTASGGSGSGYTYTSLVTSGVMPTGVTIVGGVIATSGTQVTGETCTVTITVTDSAGGSVTSAPITITIT